MDDYTPRDAYEKGISQGVAWAASATLEQIGNVVHSWAGWVPEPEFPNDPLATDEHAMLCRGINTGIYTAWQERLIERP